LNLFRRFQSANSQALACFLLVFYNRFPIGGTAHPRKRILFDSNQIQRWQQQKQVSLVLLKLAGILLVLGVGMRFISPVNDWLSGPPEPMRAIAEQLAKASANATGVQYPIIVQQNDNPSCQDAQHNTSEDYDLVLYLITYSEKSRSICLTTFVHFPNGPELPNTVMLSESAGRNYGHSLPLPLKGVPIENRLTSYPTQYLSLLHWRKKVVFPLAHAGQLNAHTRQFAPNGPSDSVGMDLRFEDLRAAVAERHNKVNRVLSVVSSVFALSFVALGSVLWMLFRRFRRYCYNSFAYVVNPGGFLFDDLDILVLQAQRQYLVQQQELQEQQRAQTAAQHSADEARERLQSLFEHVHDEKVRVEIKSCLERDQLEEMTAVFERYRALVGQKTSEERLSLLLESLRPYCSSEEFEEYRSHAFTILRQSGFRQARESVVGVHDEQRKRFKKSLDERAEEDLEDAG
jgi:hypothetical protein